MTPTPYRLDLHDFDQSPRDITGLVQAMSWTHATAGGGSASFSLGIPLRDWGTKPPILPGQWLVVRYNGKALWWGRISSVSTGRMAGMGATPHGIATLPIDVAAETYTSMLGQARIILAPGTSLNIPGAVYQFRSWAPAMAQWMRALETRLPGELLASIFAELARQSLPESLGGEAVGDAVPVAWDEAIAPDALASRFEPVPGFALQAFGNALPNGTIWSMIQGTFGADPLLVEMFPGVYPGTPATGLERVLGCHARLIYRMAPLHPNLPVTGEGVALTGLFQKAPKGYAAEIPSSDVFGWSVSWSDSERRNAFFAQTYLQPGSQMGAYGILGTPIVDPVDALRHGLRLYEAAWPFFPAAGEEGAESATIVAAIDAVVEYAAHALQTGHALGEGALSIRSDPFLRPGDWITAEVGAGVPWSCYLRAVTHSVDVDAQERKITSTTQLQFSRGFFGRTGVPTPARARSVEAVSDILLDVSGIV